MNKEFIQKLAEYLHKNFCSGNHIDYCSWYYEEGEEDTWERYSHKEWFGRARAILEYINQIKVENI